LWESRGNTLIPIFVRGAKRWGGINAYTRMLYILIGSKILGAGKFFANRSALEYSL